MAAVGAPAAPCAHAVPGAESRRTSRAFRNTPAARSRGWPGLTQIVCVNPGHPLWVRAELLRETRALCTKAHTPEDDGARPDDRSLPFPR